jgi:hypothetical protein
MAPFHIVQAGKSGVGAHERRRQMMGLIPLNTTRSW